MPPSTLYCADAMAKLPVVASLSVAEKVKDVLVSTGLGPAARLDATGPAQTGQRPTDTLVYADVPKRATRR